MNRLVIVPDEKHESLGAELKPKLAAIAREITANNLPQLMGERTLALLESIAARETCELLLWGREGNGYAVAWAGKACEADLRGKARADAGEGMVARVFESGRSETEVAEFLEISEWSNLAQLLGKSLSSMSASPVQVFDGCAVAVTRVNYGAGETPPPSETASLLSRLIEDRLIRMSIGLEPA